MFTFRTAARPLAGGLAAAALLLAAAWLGAGEGAAGPQTCYALTTVVASGSGTITVAPGSAGGCPAGHFPPGYPAAVAATAGPGHRFDAWSGTDNDASNPTTVTMHSDRTVQAYFVSNCARLTTAIGSGSGSITAVPSSAGGCPTGQYSTGYPVSLLAQPAGGFAFTGWSGTDHDGVNPTTVTMNGDRHVVAHFESNCRALTTKVGSGNGSIITIPNSSGGCPNGSYAHGALVTLGSSPASGYVWSGWSGTDNDTTHPTTVTMTSDRHVTVFFTRNCHPLTVNIASGAGTVQRIPTSAGGCAANHYPNGYTVTLAAQPAAGYTWSRWSGTDNDTTHPTSVGINGPTKVGVYFSGPPVATATPTPPLHTPTPWPPASTPGALDGDVDCDGRVTAIDAAFILQRAASLVASLPCPQRADMNGDGLTNAIDSALVLQYVAGLLAR